MTLPGFGNSYRHTKEAMKKTTRLSIEFRHREVAITVEGSTLHVQESGPVVADPSTVCPTCGSCWVEIAARADGTDPTSVDRVRYALQQFGSHMQISPAGQLRICTRSLEELKEEL